MTNQRDQDLATRTEYLTQLRGDITDQLATVQRLAAQLDDLADTRQTIGLGVSTEQTRAARGRRDAADRAAARGLTGRDTRPGLTWMNPITTAGAGHTDAPVTMPAVSVAAQISTTLRRHIRRLAKPARTALLAGPGYATHGPMTRAAAALSAQTVNPDDRGVDNLTDRLGVLVAVYTSTKDLNRILRDLDHLARLARDVLEGPAKSNHPDVCPHCGASSLVIHHRTPGRDTAFIRCEGTHPCRCDYEWCHCHRDASRDRHEWTNSRNATNNWHQLRRAQDNRRDQMDLEHTARDTLDQVRALHAQMTIYPSNSDCPTQTLHEDDGWTESTDGYEICTACEPLWVACATCRTVDGDHHLWPCPTAELLDPTDQEN